MTVYIYHGHGASQTDARLIEFMFSMFLHPHGIPVKRVMESDLNNPAAQWQRDGDLIVFGGGEFTKVKEKLSAYGRQAIIDFASRKSYLGICKGGYAGASQIRFFGEDGHKTSDGFGFFNGVAKGSLPIAPALYTGKSNSAQIAKFRHEKYGIEFPALYWGGPCFEGNFENAQKLVTLRSGASDKEITMGIKVPVGEYGQAVLLGYHAEAATPTHIENWVLQFSESQNDIARIKAQIAAHERWKFYIGFACVLDDLGIVPHHSFLRQILNPTMQDKNLLPRMQKQKAHTFG